jgi:hypothetical protein
MIDETPIAQKPRQIVSAKGLLSPEKSRAIMERLKGSVEPTGPTRFNGKSGKRDPYYKGSGSGLHTYSPIGCRISSQVSVLRFTDFLSVQITLKS